MEGKRISFYKDKITEEMLAHLTEHYGVSQQRIIEQAVSMYYWLAVTTDKPEEKQDK